MTGMEAWSLIAPIISAHSVYKGEMTVLDEAYVVTYEALKRLDEAEKGNFKGNKLKERDKNNRERRETKCGR